MKIANISLGSCFKITLQIHSQKKNDLIPISVEDCPSILAKGNTLRISSDELKSVQSFITLNKEIFLKYMNDTHFGMHDFFAAMKLSS